jgi:hypothetical protein
MFRKYLHRVHESVTPRRRKARSSKFTRTSRPPAARLRVEGLEARELLTAYSLPFYVNPAQSILNLSGTVSGAFGADITPQGTGALSTQYSGKLNTLYDPTAHTLQFLLSGSTMEAANSGSWYPNISGDNFAQPANYGGNVQKYIIGLVENGYLAVRDFGGGLSTPNPVSVSGGDIAPVETLNITQGGLAYWYRGIYYDANGATVLISSVSNSGAVTGSFQDHGDGSYHISVPINVSLDVATGGGETAHMKLTGTLDATGSFCSAGVSGGVLTATNAGPAATYKLDHAGSTTTICGASFADNSYSSVVINTGAGNDTVNIETTLANKPVTVNEGNGNVTVNISPVAHNLNNIQGGVTLHAGLGIDSLNVDDQANAFAQTFTVGATSVTRGGVAIITYGSDVNFVTLNAGNGTNTFDVFGTEATWDTILNTGNGHDMVKIDGTGYGGTLTINDGTGGVDVNLGATSHNLDSHHSAVNVNGNSQGQDSLTVDDQANGSGQTFTVDGLSITRSGAGVIHYNLMSNVTVSTGMGGATVNVLGTSTPTSIVGHENGTVNVGNFGSVEQIMSTLSISDPPANAYVTINVDDSTDLASPTVMLDAVDPFTYRIAGLSIGDIDYRISDTRNVTVKTGAGGATVYALATADPVSLIGNPNGAVSLFGSDADNTWNITGQNAGTLSSSSLAGIVTFTGATSLQGGAGANYFTFADGAGVDGTITGGGGVNTLDYSAYSTSVTVNLQVGFATGVGMGVSNIQNVTGGTGGPAGTYNLLIGNGGNVLTGGTGRRNILVAGGSASTLNGGDQDDLLIAGSTVYDSDPTMAAWSQIAAEWASSDEFATRVMNLSTGNGVPLLDPTTVFGNGGGNTLNGNCEWAWIFTDNLDTISCFDANSVTTQINP